LDRALRYVAWAHHGRWRHRDEFFPARCVPSSGRGGRRDRRDVGTNEGKVREDDDEIGRGDASFHVWRVQQRVCSREEELPPRRRRCEAHLSRVLPESVASETTRVHVWRVQQRDCSREAELPPRCEARVWHLLQQSVASETTRVHVWRVQQRGCSREAELPPRCEARVWHLLQQSVASETTRVHVWRVQQRDCSREAELPPRRWTRVQFVPPTLREGFSKQTVKYFDLELILERVVPQTSGA